MKVKVIKSFIDIRSTKNTVREVGDIFEVSSKRFADLTTHVYGPFVIEIKETKEVREEKRNG